MRTYVINVCEEVYGQITVEAENPEEVASIIKDLQEKGRTHPLYNEVIFTHTPEDFRVLDEFDTYDTN